MHQRRDVNNVDIDIIQDPIVFNVFIQLWKCENKKKHKMFFYILGPKYVNLLS